MHRDQLLAHIASASGVLDASGQQAFVAAHDAPAPVSIRINPAKWSGTSPLRPVPWAAHAYYTDGRPSFTFDPLFHAGAYYVQEASSMFLEQAVKACGLANADIIALDLCAAPGGKSTHLLSILGDDALLVSNEVVRPRAKILCDNITKWGRPNVCVTGSDTALFAGLPEFFDLVVVDAPCSGEGLFPQGCRCHVALERGGGAAMRHPTGRHPRARLGHIAPRWASYLQHLHLQPFGK
jgi:16S rRNA C967 or C1407 C5-methylase (RsmB/RsmF family)